MAIDDVNHRRIHPLADPSFDWRLDKLFIPVLEVFQGPSRSLLKLIRSLSLSLPALRSGSTGKPKGVVHTSGGYMVYAATTFKYVRITMYIESILSMYTSRDVHREM